MGGTPSHHPFRTMGFSITNQPFRGTPMAMEPPIDLGAPAVTQVCCDRCDPDLWRQVGTAARAKRATICRANDSGPGGFAAGFTGFTLQTMEFLTSQHLIRERMWCTDVRESCMKSHFLGLLRPWNGGPSESEAVPSPSVSRNFVASHELTEVVEVPTVTRRSPHGHP